MNEPAIYENVAVDFPGRPARYPYICDIVAFNDVFVHVRRGGDEALIPWHQVAAVDLKPHPHHIQRELRRRS